MAAIEQKGITPISADSEYVPATHVELPEDQMKEVLELVGALEEDDDVQNVYSNLDIPDELLAKLPA